MRVHNQRSKSFNKAFTFIILSLLILTIIRFLGSYLLLKTDSKYGKGTIKKVYYDDTISYEYFVEGKRYVGSFDDWSSRKLKEGETFLVVYSRLLPSISIFLADKPCIYSRTSLDTIKVDKSDIKWSRF